MSRYKRLSLKEFEAWLKKMDLSRYVDHYQHHHTAIPALKDYTGVRTIEGMERYHVDKRGWRDIGQHFTFSPKGIYICRDIEWNPAGILGHNKGGIMTEVIGNFDKGNDKLDGDYLDLVAKATALVIKYTRLSYDDIVFHREHAATSCPGNTIQKSWFLNQVKNAYKTDSPSEKVTSRWTGQVLRRSKDQDPATEELQRLLKMAGFTPGAIDGYYGPMTEKAVREAQRAMKITIDGIAGPETYKHLTAKVDEKKAAEDKYIYRVQTGAFRNKENADNLEKKLAGAGFDAWVTKGSDNLFRVQSGAFHQETNAKTWRKKLQQAGFDTHIVKGGR